MFLVIVYFEPVLVDLGDKIKNNNMGGECGTYGGDVYTVFWWENLRKRNYLQDLGVDGMIVLKWIFKKLDWSGLEWLDLFR